MFNAYKLWKRYALTRLECQFFFYSSWTPATCSLLNAALAFSSAEGRHC